MQKFFIIKPDKAPYSLCANSYAKGFRLAGFFTEKAFSSELDNDYIKSFAPDYVMCFDFTELKEGLLQELKQINPNCKFIFNFLTKLDEKREKANIELLNNFESIVFTADKDNLAILPNAHYLPVGVSCKKYKTVFQGYRNTVTVMSNPDNINVLKTIIDLIIHFGKISIYADEFDYINSLENELWAEYDDVHLLELYKASYKGECSKEKDRARVFSSSVITVVPQTEMQHGVDYRIFEGIASSGFVLCESNPEIKRLFDIGHELETYEKPFELIDKVKFYLKNPNIASAIGDNARRAAVNNHSVIIRVKKILEFCDKKK